MTATVKRLDPTQVELEISISRDELEAARERAFRQLVRSARIPGFRPGKAPRKIFEAQYGTEGIEERAMESVVPEAYSQALKENQLEPVERPQMEMLPEEEAGGPLRLRATVSVRPDIALGKYKGLELERPATPVADEDVDRTIEALRRDAAVLTPVDRPVAIGDVATLDYEGSIDDVPFEGGKAENAPTEISEGRFIPGFAQGIVGMTAGESRNVTARFPDDYASKPELAGKDAVFAVTVHEVKTPELPPLDDEFAKRFHADADLAKLRTDVRGRLEENTKTRGRRVLGSQLMERLLASHDFPLPEVMVERETESLVDEAKTYVARAGIGWDEYLKEQSKTEDEMRAEYRAEAEKRVKSTLLLEAIAGAEKIEATNKDIEAEVSSLGRQYGQPREAILEMLRPNFGALVDGIVRSKTLDFLVDQARVVEIPAVPAQTVQNLSPEDGPGAGATNPAAP